MVQVLALGLVKSLSKNLKISFFLFFLFAVSLFGGSDLLERELYNTCPEALSHLFFIDSLNTDFNPLSSQRVGYSFFKSDWMEYSAFKFEQALFQSRSEEERDWVSFWFGLSYLRYGKIEDMYEEVARFDTPWANLWKGLALFEMGQIDSARIVLSQVIERPSIQKIIRLEGKYLLGLSYLESDIEEAEIIFEEILIESPKSILTGEILFRLAVVDLESDSLLKALDRLQECENYYLSSSRKDAHWWAEDMFLLLGALNYKIGRFSISRQRLTEMLEVFPETEYQDRARHLMLLCGLREWGIDDESFRIPPIMNPRMKWDLLFNLAYEHYSLSNYQQASEIFLMTLKYVEEPEDKWQSYYFLAESYYAIENYEYAAEYFGLSTSEENFLSSEALWGLAWSQSKRKLYAEARDAFEKVAVRDDTLGIRAKFQVGMTYYNERKYFKAIEKLDEFSRKNRCWLVKDAQYYALKATERVNDSKMLATRTEQFVRDFPYTKQVEQFLVSSILRLNAVEEFENSINLSDILLERELSQAVYDSIFHFSQLAKLRRGDYSDIQLFLDKYSPDNHLYPSLVATIADSFSNDGNFEKSMLIWEQLKTPDVSDSLFAYSSFRQAQCFLVLGDISGAKRNIDQIVGELPESKYSPEGLLLISKWFIGEDDFENAIANIERTRELYPESQYEQSSNLLLGEVYSKIEKYPEARSLLTSIPNDSLYRDFWEEAQIDIMQSFIDQGKYQRALDFYMDNVDTLTQIRQCLFEGQLGHVHSLMGNITTADSIFTSITNNQEKCGQKIPGHIYFIWGDLMEKAREYDKACSLLTLVITEEASDSIIRQAREKIFEIENEREKK